jgi:hypothetical protein
MTFLLLLPVILSFLVLAAHFMYAGNLALVVVSLAIPFLLLIRRRWIIWAIQILLLLAAFEWLMTMIRLIGQYQQEGRPWTRMVIILGAVMIFTAASGTVFAIPRLQKRYLASG